MLSKKNLTIRKKFAAKVTKMPKHDFWTKGISFYLDGVGFVHKVNPKDEARSTKTMLWRKPGEGLSQMCRSKGKKEGSGGHVANFVVAVGYNKGVICCEQYLGNMNEQLFADFIRENFPQMFEHSANPKWKLFLQDGDPNQNSKKAHSAMDQVGCKLFSIPPRSPDINPIVMRFVA